MFSAVKIFLEDSALRGRIALPGVEMERDAPRTAWIKMIQLRLKKSLLLRPFTLRHSTLSSLDVSKEHDKSVVPP